MMSLDTIDRQKLVEIAERHQIAYLALFGSYARGQAQPSSDIDLYARFGRPIGLFEVLGIKHEMEDALGLAVDLIVEEAVEPYRFIRASIAKDRLVLYEDNPHEHAVS